MKIGRYEASDKSSVGTAVTFLMIGVGVGALVALLFAPKSGKQMRKDIRRKFEDARETLEDWSDEAQERIGDAVDKVQNTSAEWAEELRNAAREKAAPIGRALRRD